MTIAREAEIKDGEEKLAEVLGRHLELTEKDNEFAVRAAVAGVDPKNIEILVSPEIMLIKAEPQHQDLPEKGTVHRCEFPRGKLSRSIEFPKAIDPDRVHAEIKDGVLSIKAEIAHAKAETSMPLAA